jgi:hypothetical protein
MAFFNHLRIVGAVMSGDIFRGISVEEIGEIMKEVSAIDRITSKCWENC